MRSLTRTRNQTNKAPLARQLAAQLRRSRICLFSILLPLAAFTIAGAVDSTLRLLYILLGFSLIIFLHELGHFVVARLCSVKCLAFSLGIGPRMLGWRKGGKLSFGSDPYDPDSQSKLPAKETPEDKVTISSDKGLVQIEPDTKNLTSDILGKSQPSSLEKTEAATTHSDLPTTAETPPHPLGVGDCDYRVSWLPLGGYVRMLGQDDMDPTKISQDPHAFNRRPIWQRMCIVSAGVIMNIIFAAVCFSIIFSPGIGVEFPPAVVGPVHYNMPAWGQFKMGDRVVAINGKEARGFMEFVDVQMASALSDGTEHVEFRVHPADGGPDRTVSILPTRDEGAGLLAAGVEAMPGVKLAAGGQDQVDFYTDPKTKALPDWIELNRAELLKIRAGDKITAVNDVPLPQDSLDVNPDVHPYIPLYNAVQQANGKPVTLTLNNVKDKSLPPLTISILPHLETVPGARDYPSVFGINPRLMIHEPSPGSPAATKGLKAGDRIVRIGERTNPTTTQFIDIVKSHPDEPLQIVVEREVTGPSTAPGTASAAHPTQMITFTIAPKNEKGKGLLGVPLDQDIDSTAISTPTDDSAVGAMNLPQGTLIVAIDGQPTKTWDDIYAQLRGKEAGAKVQVSFSTPPSDQTVSKELTLSKEDYDAIHTLIHYQLGLRLENETRNQHGRDAWEAVLMGMDHTKKFILQVYMTLAGLFRGTVSADNLHGIVGITKVGYDVQERGPVWLWYVLAMVSVNLAVANFLPLPIVDGGLFLLLILEKIRGKPLSLKVQSAIQVVGIVLLAGLFLFVTWNDLGLFAK